MAEMEPAASLFVEDGALIRPARLQFRLAYLE
jgi:hypothetical protein